MFYICQERKGEQRGARLRHSPFYARERGAFKFSLSFFFKDFICLLLERGEGREGEKHQCVRDTGCFSQGPNWRPGPQPRHVPRLATEPVTFQFTGWCLVH